MALTDKIKAIADAIRAKTGQTGTLTLDAMPTAISGISGGGPEAYVEETYNINRELISAKLVGQDFVRMYAFANCERLKSVELPSGVNSIRDRAFSGCTRLKPFDLPASLSSIGQYAFTGCSAFTSVVIPAGVIQLHAYALSSNINLESVTFLGTPNSIASSVFYFCNKLTTINVPWAEGEVANAPWGATNATINYNYTGE